MKNNIVLYGIVSILVVVAGIVAVITISKYNKVNSDQPVATIETPAIEELEEVKVEDNQSVESTIEEELVDISEITLPDVEEEPVNYDPDYTVNPEEVSVDYVYSADVLEMANVVLNDAYGECFPIELYVKSVTEDGDIDHIQVGCRCTELVFICDIPKGGVTEDIYYDYGNWHGSDYPVIYFTKGIPENTEIIYSEFLEQNGWQGNLMCTDYYTEDGETVYYFRNMITGEEYNASIHEEQ